jgi:hypothetical protein
MLYTAALDTIIGTVLEVFVYLGTLEEGLGGNTTPVETNASEAFLFDDRYLESEL